MTCRNSKCGCRPSGTDDPRSKTVIIIDDRDDFESPNELEGRIQDLNPHIDSHRYKQDSEPISSVVNDYLSE